MNVFDVLEPIYGDLASPKNRIKMIDEWLRSKAFQVSGLQAETIRAQVLSECRGGSDFLRIVMDAVAQKQGVDRWIDSTPTNIPHLLRIKKDFPDARVVHIVRDGRDVALSLDKRGWSRPLPWDRDRSLLAAGLYWEWIVRKGQKLSLSLRPNYIEIKYEDLVAKTQATLAQLANFLQHDLNYERIQQASIGSVRSPLTAFPEELRSGSFAPVGRWKTAFPADQLLPFERLVGDYLSELGYVLSDANTKKQTLTAKTMRWTYLYYYEFKQWAKINTPLSRLMVDYSAVLIDK
jgi:hypothetical protein